MGIIGSVATWLARRETVRVLERGDLGDSRARSPQRVHRAIMHDDEWAVAEEAIKVVPGQP